jgi:hypothetical protein
MKSRKAVAQFEGSLVRQLEIADLSRAFRVVVNGPLSEVRCVDENLARRLQEPLTRLIENEPLGLPESDRACETALSECGCFRQNSALRAANASSNRASSAAVV